MVRKPKGLLSPGQAGNLVYRPPPEVKHRPPRVGLTDEARRMGIYLLAGKGSGKSRLMGRAIGWQDLIRGIPQVILDPLGPTIDNLLDKVIKSGYQQALWPRILYLDMGGRERVPPFPIYYRLGDESHADVASRFLEAVKRIDPKLTEAPMQGWNAIQKVGIPTGAILSGLGLQITDAPELLNDPISWQGQLRQLAAETTDRGLINYLKFFMEPEDKHWQSSEWKRMKESLETKLSLFVRDNATIAMFGSAISAINWQQVVDEGLTVLLDFRHELDQEMRRFKMLWAFLYFLAFLKHRGAGRHKPIGLIVDEITALYNFDAQAGSDIFASDLDELINVWARNANCWLTLAHQERFQINEKTRKVLMGMGTNILGVTSDMEAALEMATELFKIDPHQVKRYENIWMMDPLWQAPYVIDKNPVEYSIEEQQYMHAYKLKHLGKFQFWVKAAGGEGDLQGGLKKVSIANLDRGEWIDEALVAEARRQLSLRDTLPVKKVLAAIDQRQEQWRHLPVKSATPTNGAADEVEPSASAAGQAEPASVDDQRAKDTDWLEELAG